MEKENKCAICEKPTRPGTNVCSTKCLVSKGKLASEGKPLNNVFKQVHDKSLETKATQEVPMVVLRHARLKAKNVYCAGVNFSFDKNGLCSFPKMEPAMGAARLLVKFSKGAITFVDLEQEAKEKEAKAKEKEAKAKAKIEKKVEKIEKKIEKKIEEPSAPIKVAKVKELLKPPVKTLIKKVTEVKTFGKKTKTIGKKKSVVKKRR
jgi:hypothetical protein